ncbi:MAG: hypothetical protein AAF192_15190, partial [Pseudomonadota bacterium]
DLRVISVPRPPDDFQIGLTRAAVEFRFVPFGSAPGENDIVAGRVLFDFDAAAFGPDTLDLLKAALDDAIL